MRGDRDGACADGTEAIAMSERLGWAWGVEHARSALGFLALSESNPESAVALLEPLATAVGSTGVYEYPIAMSIPDAIEAFIATGATDRAARLTNAFNRFGRDVNRPWALARSGRCRALLEAAAGNLESALAAAEQALVDHEPLPIPLELGRTLLVLGQIQRRRGERKAARETFQRAHAIFARIGASLWFEKAAAEIARIGVRRAPKDLTESESRVAELAAQGLSNPEIAGRLFMSRRTVEANLSRAYGKLGIRSRAELGTTMARRRSPADS
jgi:DNA-binding CsgD family transcriptional regulator